MKVSRCQTLSRRARKRVWLHETTQAGNSIWIHSHTFRIYNPDKFTDSLICTRRIYFRTVCLHANQIVGIALSSSITPAKQQWLLKGELQYEECWSLRTIFFAEIDFLEKQLTAEKQLSYKTAEVCTFC